jgi:hypothetical protein
MTTATSRPVPGQVCQLNDRLRQTGVGGRLLLTPGIQALFEDALEGLMQAIAEFDAFNADNDPWGEHDFGNLEFCGQRVFWKIDYYNCSLDGSSPDPSDPAVTLRVLTIMLAEEY